MAHHPQQQGFQRFSLKAFLRFKDFLCESLCEKMAQTLFPGVLQLLVLHHQLNEDKFQ
jgi:hypothetical protein